MRHDRAVGAAAIITPFLLIVAVRGIAGVSPSAVQAVQGDDHRTPDQAPRLRVDPEVQEWLASLPLGPDLASPMDHPDPETRPTVINDRDPLVGVRLSSVIGSGDSGIAAINGELFRIGGEPAPGCEIVEIDARAQRVRIRLPDGRVRELVRER